MREKKFAFQKQNKTKNGQIIASLYREQTAIICSLITQRFRPESVVWMKYRVAEYEATYYPENLSSKCSSKRFKSQTRLLSDVFAKHGLDSRWRSPSVILRNNPSILIFMTTQTMMNTWEASLRVSGMSNTL